MEDVSRIFLQRNLLCPEHSVLDAVIVLVKSLNPDWVFGDFKAD